jgi:diguanylate cyclase (GGDEF)-like protein
MPEFKHRISLYLTLVLTIVSTVLVVLALDARLGYKELKSDALSQMKTNSAKTVDVLEKNIATLMESYAINEYDKLVFNALKSSQHLAIIVKDYNMGKILGLDTYASGAIRLNSKQITNYDSQNQKHEKIIKKAFFKQTKEVLSSQGKVIGNISLYISDKILQDKLNILVKNSIFDFVFISIIITIVLSLTIYFFVLKPISDISNTLSTRDDDGIPTKSLKVDGPKEVSSLSRTINFMLDAIRKSRLKIELHNKELDYIAKHDMLTDLPNRFLFSKYFQTLLDKTKIDKTNLALLYIDLDGFKDINDKYGRDIGDKLLIKVSHKIKTLLKEEDFVARLGGDEFVVAIGNLSSTKEIIPLLNDFLELLRQKVQNPKNEKESLKMSASIGATFYPQENEIGPEALLRQADQAMYDAKKLGKNQYHIFNLDIDSSIKEHLRTIQDFELSLKNNDFVLFYQPKVNMPTNKIIGFEALLRWRHPKKGLLYPDEFLPKVNGQKELMLGLGEWVVSNAFEQYSQWRSAGYSFGLSINISAHEFKETKTFNLLKNLLEKYPNISPSDIEFEILETHAFDDIAQANKMIRTFQKLGFNIALDDFGTGYSTLSYLKDLSINTLKIDKSFVMDMLNDRASLSILEATIGLADAFECDVIAEGVESVEHGNILIQLGCSQAQGYVLSKAMPADEVLSWTDLFKGNESWEKTAKSSFYDNSALYATVEHRQWIKDINNYLNDPKEHIYIPELDEHKCAFSSWLNGDAKKQFSKESLDKLTNIHSQIHKLAKKAVDSDAKQKDGFIDDILKLHEEITHIINMHYRN